MLTGLQELGLFVSCEEHAREDIIMADVVVSSSGGNIASVTQ
jgi:hypothetical protein